MRALTEAPLFVVLIAIGALAMQVPAIHAVMGGHYAVARSFFYSGILFLGLSLLLGLAGAANAEGRTSRAHLVTMLASFLLLPLELATPFYLAVPDTTLFRSWWEMVSCLTTTGATLYDPERLIGSLHLWRALIGWLGGYFILVMAIAVLAPLRLGGFEIFGSGAATHSANLRADPVRAVGGGEAPTFFTDDIAEPGERIRHFARVLLPAYAGLTAVLWLLLVTVGEDGLVALCHAMSTLSTSGISPLGTLGRGEGGIPGEMFIFLFLIPALSRRLWPGGGELRASARLRDDPELRLAAVLVLLVTQVLFMRHWLAALEIDTPVAPGQVLRSVWGGLFTSLSFLTTTGFASGSWNEARTWSGLGTPGLILAGLAVTGGGIATTAGGIRLLRIYALLRHGERELVRLVHPAAVHGGGPTARWLRRQGAYTAWIFFMLFMLSGAVIMAAVSLAGMRFEPAAVMTISALSNTGPLAAIALDTPLRWSELDTAPQFILALAMVLGRLETLAIVALFNPDFWRG
ncbi:potassium transporter TrkG [Paenirhodobacter populi]|uniref:TrkH family potassium uptake protein n=1 Tax=Paenirhodobacter populi TaxID=2306993 RepID=A0A443JE33_9RHOB|nr:potassium transporter TrkG [Sinirhodobacter populi]RWR18744.1 TrkH family potassium uptake protein [Sinirhodobacter populi]